MNVGGYYYPAPHKDWGQCSEELLFHKSRYASHAAKFLVRLGGVRNFSLSTYRSADLQAEQKACLARLLQLPPSGPLAIAIIKLVQVVENGGAEVPAETWRLAENIRPNFYLRVLYSRPKQSMGLDQVSAEEVIRHLATRYHFPLRIRGKVIWLDCVRCDLLLHSRKARIRDNMLEALKYLNRSGYLVHLRRVKHTIAA